MGEKGEGRGWGLGLYRWWRGEAASCLVRSHICCLNSSRPTCIAPRRRVLDTASLRTHDYFVFTM